MRFPDIKYFVFKPKGNKYDSLEPLTNEPVYCKICTKEILIAIFKNDGVCGVKCQKIRDGEDTGELGNV